MIFIEIPSFRLLLFLLLLLSTPSVSKTTSVHGGIYLNSHLCSTWQWIALEDFQLIFLFSSNDIKVQADEESILRNSVKSGLLESLIEAAIINDGNVTLAFRNYSQLSTDNNVEFVNVIFETIDLLNATSSNNNNCTIMLHGGSVDIIHPCYNKDGNTLNLTTDNPSGGSRTLLQQRLLFSLTTITTIVMQSILNQASYLIDQLNLTSYNVTLVVPQLIKPEEADQKNNTITSPSPKLFTTRTNSPSAGYSTTMPWKTTTPTANNDIGAVVTPTRTKSASPYPVVASASNNSKADGTYNDTLFLATTRIPSKNPIPSKLPTGSSHNNTNTTTNSTSSRPHVSSMTRQPKKPTIIKFNKPSNSLSGNITNNTNASNAAKMSDVPSPSIHNNSPMPLLRPIVAKAPEKPSSLSIKKPKASSNAEHNNTYNTKLSSPYPLSRTVLPTDIIINGTASSPTVGDYGINNMSRNDDTRSGNAIAVSKSKAFPPIFIAGLIFFIIFGVMGIAFFVKKRKTPVLKTSVGPKSPLKNTSRFHQLIMKNRSSSTTSDTKNHHPFSPQFMMPKNRLETPVSGGSSGIGSVRQKKTPDTATPITNNVSDARRTRASSPAPERSFQRIHSDNDELDLISIHSANTTVSSFFQIDPDWDPNDDSNDDDDNAVSGERKGNLFVVSSRSKNTKHSSSISTEGIMRRFPLQEGSSSHSLEFSISSDDVSQPSSMNSSASKFGVSRSPKKNILYSSSTPPGSRIKTFTPEEGKSSKRLAHKKIDKQSQSVSPKLLSSRSTEQSETTLTKKKKNSISDDINDEWDVLCNNRFQTLSAYELDLMDPKRSADDVVFL